MSDPGVRTRPGRPADHIAVMGVLDAAMLAVDAGTVRERLADGDVVLAVDGDRLLGALVLDGREVEAVAVRPGRRGTGIGTALVEAALDRRGGLVAEFDARVRPFYRAMGFEIEPIGDGRYRGLR